MSKCLGDGGMETFPFDGKKPQIELGSGWAAILTERK